jgi:AraC-like DNA-binding protein
MPPTAAVTAAAAPVAATGASTARPAVLALLRDRDAVARVTDALRPGVPGAPPAAGAGIRSVARVADLRDALAARPYALVVVEARDADGVSTEETVRALRARHPSLAVLGYATARPGLSGDVLALARAGVHELVVAGIDDVATVLRAALARTARRSSAERLLAELAGFVPADALPLLRYGLEHAAAAPTVEELARALGVSRQALATRMRAAGLPAPRALAVWCRLLLAAELLAGAGRSVDEVSLTLDFPSSNAFRNVLRRHAGVGPSDVRRAGSGVVLAAFQAALVAGQQPDAPARPRARPAPPPAPALTS